MLKAKIVTITKITIQLTGGNPCLKAVQFRALNPDNYDEAAICRSPSY